jgi:topoisomerase IA-like protein
MSEHSDPSTIGSQFRQHVGLPERKNSKSFTDSETVSELTPVELDAGSADDKPKPAKKAAAKKTAAKKTAKKGS